MERVNTGSTWVHIVFKDGLLTIPNPSGPSVRLHYTKQEIITFFNIMVISNNDYVVHKQIFLVSSPHYA